MNPVKKICEITGLKMSEVARACGYTHQQVQIWHSGRRGILFENVLKICARININPVSLFDDYKPEQNTDITEGREI